MSTTDRMKFRRCKREELNQKETVQRHLLPAMRHSGASGGQVTTCSHTGGKLPHRQVGVMWEERPGFDTEPGTQEAIACCLNAATAEQKWTNCDSFKISTKNRCERATFSQLHLDLFIRMCVEYIFVIRNYLQVYD